jgi:hypothetical protein
MKKTLQVKYPWSQLKRGQGFFVPCLDTEAVKQDGLRKALAHRIFHAKARIGVKNGLIGVWFHL